MKPIKAKEFIPEVAANLELNEDLVQAVISFYWREVRKSLSSIKHSRIHLTNLGDFVIKQKKLDDNIAKLERFEEYNRLRGLQKMTARFKTVETLYDLKNLKGVIEQEKQRAEFIKLHKKTAYVNKEKPDNNLEEQGSDSGGDN